LLQSLLPVNLRVVLRLALMVVGIMMANRPEFSSRLMGEA
jgi:hypothetical protein